MAVSITGTPVTFNGSGNRSGTIDIPSGTTCVQMYLGGFNWSGDTISGTLAGEVPDDQVQAVHGDNDGNVIMIWANPSIANGVAWAVTGGDAPDAQVGAIYCLSGADGDEIIATGWPDVDGGAIGGDPGAMPSVTLTSVSGDLACDAFTAFDENSGADRMFPGANQTQISEGVHTGQDSRTAGSYEAATTTSVTMSWTGSSGVDPQVYHAVIVPVAAAGSVELVVADATHGHSADNTTLTQANILAMQDATHGHSVDNVSLVQANLLEVADALHAHSADSIAFQVMVSRVLRNRAGSVRAGLAGLEWAFLDQARPDIFAAAINSGADEETDGSGHFQVPVPDSELSNGQIGFIIISNTAGNAANQSLAHAAPAPVTFINGVPTVSLILTDADGSILANLTGLNWAFFDEPLPGNFAQADDAGSGESTNGSGVFDTFLPNTSLTSGQTGFLIVSDTDGDDTVQSNAHAAPIVVA